MPPKFPETPDQAYDYNQVHFLDERILRYSCEAWELIKDGNDALRATFFDIPKTIKSRNVDLEIFSEKLLDIIFAYGSRQQYDAINMLTEKYLMN